jgi:THO complex subunit 4
MSGKLDQSLDEILSTRSRGGPRRSLRRSGGRATTAPVGGIHKTSKPARTTAAKPITAKTPVSGDSKIIVSNLVRQSRARSPSFSS